MEILSAKMKPTAKAKCFHGFSILYLWAQQCNTLTQPSFQYCYELPGCLSIQASKISSLFTFDSVLLNILVKTMLLN
jgi:hypothetical protein